MFRVFSVTAALLLVAAPAQACVMTLQEKHNLFVNFDRNRDGWLSMFEYMYGETNRFGANQVDQKALEARFGKMDDLHKGIIPPDRFAPIVPQDCMKQTQMSY